MAAKRIVLKNVMASYVAVLAPKKKMNSDETEYSMQVVIPKNHPQAKELRDTIVALAKEAFPKISPKTLSLGLRDADEEGRSENDSRMKGMLFLNARSKDKPQVVDRKLRVVTDDDDFYSGCTCNVSLSLFTYDKAGNRGVGAGLGNIQVTERGDRLDGRKSALDEFDRLDDGDDEVETSTVEESDDPWN